MYYDFASRTWDTLLSTIPQLKERPEIMRSHDLPDPNPDRHQDHLLFWPVGQELFAAVARALMDQNELDEGADVESMAAALSPLAKVNWDMHGVPWCYLLLVPTSDGNSWRIRSEDRKAAVEVAADVLRWITGLADLDEGDTEALRGSWRALLYAESKEEDADIEALWNEIVAIRESVVH